MATIDVALLNVPERKQTLRLGQAGELVLRSVIYLLIVIVFLLPFIWMFTGSVRNEAEIHGLMFPFNLHTIVPVEWTPQSYLDIFGISEAGAKGGFRFPLCLMNSGRIALALGSSSLVFLN